MNMAFPCAAQVIFPDYSLEEDALVDDYDPKLELPPGFPKSLSSDLAWTGSRLCGEEYIYHFTDNDKIEIDTALASFKGVKHQVSLLHSLI